jgi:hypothetical protein
MRFVNKRVGIAWGAVYFVVGSIFSFTLGGDDFWSGAAVYLALFLVPLPISFLALWFPRIAATGLICCVVVIVCVSIVSVVRSGFDPDLAGLCKFAMHTMIPNIGT